MVRNGSTENSFLAAELSLRQLPNGRFHFRRGTPCDTISESCGENCVVARPVATAREDLGQLIPHPRVTAYLHLRGFHLGTIPVVLSNVSLLLQLDFKLPMMPPTSLSDAQKLKDLYFRRAQVSSAIQALEKLERLRMKSSRSAVPSRSTNVRQGPCVAMTRDCA